MAQDTTPAIIVYRGNGDNSVPYDVPFDKGYYGEVKVLFVRRGLADYTHNPDSYTVNGRLYAWVNSTTYIYTHTPNPAVGAETYDGFDEDTGETVSAIAGQTITVNAVVYSRAVQHDIANQLLLFWTGETLTSDDFICIARDTERGQPFVFPNNQKHIEGALDNLERQIQEVKDATDNALKVDPSHTIDASKMNPIDWMETIVRSTDKSLRGVRFENGWLSYSMDDPNIAEADKTWTRVLNTTNIKNIYETVSIDPDTSEEIRKLFYTDQNGIPHEIPLQISIEDIVNIEITNPTNGQFLRFDGEKWVNSDSDVTSVDWGEIEGDIADQADLQLSFSTKVNIDGTSIMTAPLKFMAGSMRGAVGPYLNGVSFWKLDSQGNLTQIADISDSRFVPTTTNAIDIGSSTKKWKDLYLGGKAYVATLNNGADITVPATGGTLALLSDVPAAQVNSDWNAESGVAQILNKPTLATVATSGDYNDLLNRPTIPTVGDGTITITQGGETKGAFTVNQSGDTTIDLDAGGGTSSYHPDLFDWKWADHQVNDVQWLRADTFSWQSGDVYQAAYKELYDDVYVSAYWRYNGTNVSTAKAVPDAGDAVYSDPDLTTQVGTVEAYDSANNTITYNGNTYSYYSAYFGTTTAETVAGITINVYSTHSGKKIVNYTEESNVSAIYAATGVAWYYIISAYNKRFKLPRSKHEHYGDRPVVGNGITLGLTDGTNNIGAQSAASGGYITGSSTSYGTDAGSTYNNITNLQKTVGITTDSTKSGIISTPVQDTDQYKYLYFYVGEFTQTALENTAGITAETLNDKVDVGHQVIAFQAPTAGNNYTWYRKYADGWVEQGGVVSKPNSTQVQVTIPVVMSDTNYRVFLTDEFAGNMGTVPSVGNKTTSNFYVYQNNGSALYCAWYVCGVAA